MAIHGTCLLQRPNHDLRSVARQFVVRSLNIPEFRVVCAGDTDGQFPEDLMLSRSIISLQASNIEGKSRGGGHLLQLSITKEADGRMETPKRGGMPIVCT